MWRGRWRKWHCGKLVQRCCEQTIPNTSTTSCPAHKAPFTDRPADPQCEPCGTQSPHKGPGCISSECRYHIVHAALQEGKADLFNSLLLFTNNTANIGWGQAGGTGAAGTICASASPPSGNNIQSHYWILAPQVADSGSSPGELLPPPYRAGLQEGQGTASSYCSPKK